VDIVAEQRKLAHGASQAAMLMVSTASRGPVGSSAQVSFRDGEGEMRTFDLERFAPPGTLTQLGRLPALVARVDSKLVGDRVGYVRFNLFLVPVVAPFTQAVQGFIDADARGIVIDLRGNPGGVGAMVMGMAGHFIGEPDRSLGRMTTREATLEFKAIPKAPRQRFAGPVAILVDEMSLSTAELFAGGMQGLGRARVFGRRTGGMALPSIVEDLPNGDRLQFAIADLEGPAGARLEGVGVTPDQEIPLRREDLLAGVDADLEAALEWINVAAPVIVR
jgi:carboxyl-terminal processing protease